MNILARRSKIALDRRDQILLQRETLAFVIQQIFNGKARPEALIQAVLDAVENGNLAVYTNAGGGIGPSVTTRDQETKAGYHTPSLIAWHNTLGVEGIDLYLERYTDSVVTFSPDGTVAVHCTMNYANTAQSDPADIPPGSAYLRDGKGDFGVAKIEWNLLMPVGSTVMEISVGDIPADVARSTEGVSPVVHGELTLRPGESQSIDVRFVVTDFWQPDDRIIAWNQGSQPYSGRDSFRTHLQLEPPYRFLGTLDPNAVTLQGPLTGPQELLYGVGDTK